MASKVYRSALCALLLGGCAPQTWCVPAKNPSHPEAPAKIVCWKVPNLLGIDCCATIPPGAIPPPNGSYVREWEHRMVAGARADRYVIYLYEWYMGGPCLGPGGRDHLEGIARHLPIVHAPVLVQPCGDEAINQVHRQVVVQYLLDHGIADAEELVILGFPQAEGLYGFEAFRGFQVLQGGQQTGTGTGTTSGNTGGIQGGATIGIRF
jgi:hypothetical protein